VSHFGEVVFEELYDGINLVYHANNQALEYDFEVAVGADPKQIQIQVAGAQKLSVAPDGRLIISTDYGRIEEQAPFVYQEMSGEKIPVSAEFALIDNNTFGFSLPEGYDPAFRWSSTRSSSTARCSAARRTITAAMLLSITMARRSSSAMSPPPTSHSKRL